MAGDNWASWQQMFVSLCTRGEQFPDSLRRVSLLEGVSYPHPEYGNQPVAIDHYALSTTSRIYTDSSLSDAFWEYNMPTLPVTDVIQVVEAYHQNGLVWGFSGFATGGYEYADEADAMSALLQTLVNINYAPSLISDGGVSAGVLGLSGVLAAKYDIPSLGFIPLEGLASIGPRDHLVVKANTYPEREVFVGLLPDILVCVGGGDGTRRECQVALENGSIVLFLTTRDYGNKSFPGSFRSFPDLYKAEDEGRLIVLEDYSLIPSVIQKAQRQSVRTRAWRMSQLEGRLLAA